MYRLLEVGEMIQDGDEMWDKYQWKKCGGTTAPESAVIRRPLPEPLYIFLEKGEKIEDGDEVYSIHALEWVELLEGVMVDLKSLYRRRITPSFPEKDQGETSKVKEGSQWYWGKPDKEGLYWWGGSENKTPKTIPNVTHISNPETYYAGWWAYIGSIPPKPSLPEKKWRKAEPSDIVNCPLNARFRDDSDDWHYDKLHQVGVYSKDEFYFTDSRGVTFTECEVEDVTNDPRSGGSTGSP